ncbi:AI-2E family transporter [Flavobacterium sp. XN-5]|uniref:AI-2E family transporter n=1 Tax=Flavobacterium sp. XN-5 TaxID=2599390 RepID=UPI0011CB7BC8|nr:AI-2E family transporter [Flavobacterium sp. XN-5]NGY37149.1 AI-2E family transporter [Flavobacterium sp. XN-5]
MIKFPKIQSSSGKFSALEILQYIVLICFILYFGKTLFIPLSFSLLISFILFPICKWMENKGINKIGAISISILLITSLFGFIVYLLFIQINAFTSEWDLFSKKVMETWNQVSISIAERFDITTEEQTAFFKNYINNSGKEAFSLLRSSLYSISESLFFLLIIPVLSALILYYRHLLVKVLYLIFPADKKETIYEILVETIHAYYNFVKGMLLVYLLVGLLNSIGLLIIGVPHPFMFGFIASILTFIPFVGIIISALLPIAVSWITFNSIWYPIAVIVVFVIVQALEAYIIFPFAVGRRLKINALVIIIIITLGGILWGAAGMILFVPFASIAKLIADRSSRLKTLSVLLGEGDEEIKQPDKTQP